MGRELSIVRRLEKIEKELGYCQIKIEKGQRLQVQLRFMKFHRKALEDSIRRFSAGVQESELQGNVLGAMRLDDAFVHVSLERACPTIESLCERFRVAGSLGLLRKELESLTREIEDLEARLVSFGDFATKRDDLVEARADANFTFKLDGSEEVFSIAKEFDEIEGQWNVLTEDLVNLDQALTHVSHSLDYLRSARAFVMTARSQFRIETWLREGYLLDLFKHSSLGRAKEMVEGADRNMKIALREMICLENLIINPEDFENMQQPFLEVMFYDLFGKAKLLDSTEFIDQRLQRVEKLFSKLTKKRAEVFSSQESQEADRWRLFSQIGDERRKLQLAH